MSSEERTIFVLLAVIATLVLTLVVALKFEERSREKMRIDYQNQLAAKDKTQEIKNGLYEKLVVQNGNLTAALDASDTQAKELEQQVKQDKEDLYSVTQIGIHWQQAYEGLAKSQQSDAGVTKEPDGGVLVREQVNFQRDFPEVGLSVSGHVLTNPPEAYLKAWQLTPLKLTLALSQDKTKAWHAYATSNLPGIKPDIGVAEVNPYLSEEKWYERFVVQGDLGLGTTSNGLGLLAGAGVAVEIGKFQVGPHVWVTASDRLDKFLGASLTWRPFLRSP